MQYGADHLWFLLYGLSIYGNYNVYTKGRGNIRVVCQEELHGLQLMRLLASAHPAALWNGY
ncbi:MAG: hypothetical protein H6937_13030 [Burkholderiales bacterium]|nr:hypothetical protein [Burkholderiales bacterium]MCP5246813.1 hypothetical protein [Burkholderiales bacterium]MDR4516695.1 hypothetical protein [Nitrosomonas sp.]